MSESAIRIAQSTLIDAGLAESRSFEGCTEKEIQSLEKLLSVRLPLRYREFLAVMGHKAGRFLIGTDYSFPKISGFRHDAENLLKSAQSSYKLSPTSVVFLFHQGYTFLFFDCQEDVDDPAVFMIGEANTSPAKVAARFSSWLLSAVEDDVAAHRELGGH